MSCSASQPRAQRFLGRGADRSVSRSSEPSSPTAAARILGGAPPPAVRPPAAAAPEIVKALPSAVHSAYVGAFAASLRPVFAVAAGISVVAFALRWFLRA